MAHDKTLEKPNKELAKPASEGEAHVVTALIALFEALDTFGKKWTPAIAQAWLWALQQSPEITLGEFKEACSWWAWKETAFPKPVHIIEWIARNRDNRELREQMQAAIAAETERREAKVNAKMMRLFGTENPSREQLMALIDRSFDGEPRRVRRAKGGEIDPDRLRAVEDELRNRRRKEA